MDESNESFQFSEKRPSQSSDAAVAAPFLWHAAQQDVVLSQERDAYYAETLLGESASELVATLLGSRRAIILAPELKALASCLYFGLTNFTGERRCNNNSTVVRRCPPAVVYIAVSIYVLVA